MSDGYLNPVPNNAIINLFYLYNVYSNNLIKQYNSSLNPIVTLR